MQDTLCSLRAKLAFFFGNFTSKMEAINKPPKLTTWLQHI